MVLRADQAADERNGDFPWDEFDSQAYLSHNYLSVREDDRQILEVVRDFFDDASLPSGLRGIDVGTGPNLYPALTMLPFCESVTLYEYSASNVAWLNSQRAKGWPSWNEAWSNFWELLSKREAYRKLEAPREALCERAEVVQGSVFDLPRGEAGWDLGTMFFVAESITPRKDEFRSAIDCFIEALKPGAPFAVALMEHSRGYHVGDRDYPATNIGKDDVNDRFLRAGATLVDLQHIGMGENPLRVGYSGMIIAVGRVGD